MHVVAFVTQKGGSGKTTLAINVAAAATLAGRRVLLVDLDPQGTAEAWFQDRDREGLHVLKSLAAALPSVLAKARAGGFDLVLIDTPGRDEPAVAAAMRAADLCLIPCRPSPADMKATPPTIATARRLEKPAYFVLSQTPPRGYRLREAEVGLGILGPVAPVYIVSRATYQDAQGAGLGAMEFEPDGKAAAEIRNFWSWLSRRLKQIPDVEKTNDA